MVQITMGNKKRKFRSIKEAAETFGVSYMTMYMRLRAGWKTVTAVNKPVRAYRKAVV